MKRTISIFIFILLLVKNGFSYGVAGPVNACAGQVLSYSFTGIPLDNKGVTLGKIDVFGGNASAPNNANFKVTWLNYGCVEDCYIVVSNISYIDKDNVSQPVSGSYRLNVTVRKIGPIAAISGNRTPLYCNTSELTYSIPQVCKTQYYSWTIPAGWQLNPSTPSSGYDARTIKVTPDANGGGTVRVTATYNPYNGCSLSATATLNITRPVQKPEFTSTTTRYCVLTTSSAQICVAAVPNVVNYQWTYPSGWTGPASTSTPCVTMNFNGVVQTANISCKVNVCGAVSEQTNLSVTTQNSVPTDAGIHWDPPTVTSSPTPAKKNVTVYLGSFYWNVYLSQIGPNGTYETSLVKSNETSPDPYRYPVSVIMKNSDILTVNAHNKNSCGRSEGIGKGYKMVNGQLQPYELARIETPVNETPETDFRIFPNPATTQINIEMNEVESSMQIALYDLLGKKIKETVQPSNRLTNIDVSDLQNGIYFLQIENKGGVIRKEKIVLNH